MEHEVKIDGTTFTVRCFQSQTARETLDQLLKRVILKNAEKELKKRPNNELLDTKS